MAAKTTKAVAETKPEMTAEEKAAHALGRIDRSIEMMASMARAALADRNAQMAESVKAIGEQLAAGTVEGDCSASYAMLQSYWPMRDASEAAGKLKVLAMTSAHLAKVKVGREPRKAIEILRDWLVRQAMTDTSRTESSTNAFSNAISNAAGDGRGRIYRDLFDLIEGFIEDID